MSPESPLLFGMILGSAFLGSWHCAGMCGPLVAALAPAKASIWIYHAGRGVSYTAAGAFAGWLGQAGLSAPPFALRLFTALAFIFMILFVALGNEDNRWSRWWMKKATPFLRWGRQWLFMTGALSVLLPCAWLWTFLLAAAASATPLSGSLVTFALWLGSLPALALIGGYMRQAAPSAPPKWRAWARWGVVAISFYSLFSHFFFSSSF